MRYLLLFLCTVLLSCNSNEKLFEIATIDDFKSVLAEKSEKIDKKNTKLLTSSEIINSQYEYKNFGTIYENDSFKILGIICLKEKDKFYHFLARTINKGDSKIISSFLISSYNQKNNLFCSGFLTKNLLLTRKCTSDDFVLQNKIDESGRIFPKMKAK